MSLPCAGDHGYIHHARWLTRTTPRHALSSPHVPLVLCVAAAASPRTAALIGGIVLVAGLGLTAMRNRRHASGETTDRIEADEGTKLMAMPPIV